MKATLPTLLFAATLLCLSGCTTPESQSQKLQLRMSKNSVVKLMGPNYTPVAARVERDGTTDAVIKYELKKDRPLYLYFRQDELVQWGDIRVLNAMPAPESPN